MYCVYTYTQEMCMVKKGGADITPPSFPRRADIPAGARGAMALPARLPLPPRQPSGDWG